MNAFQPTFCGVPPGQTVTNNHGYVAKLSPSGTEVYATYVCGSVDADAVRGAAADQYGDLFITGNTTSPTFPLLNPVQAQYGGGAGNSFVMELSPSGGLLYSTYLGGSSDDVGIGLTLDPLGNIYVAGYTNSSNFPVVNAIQAQNAGGNDAFLTKINANGSAIVFSTYLGGSQNDRGNGLAVDPLANVYVTGQTASTNFPTLNAFQASNGGGKDAFLAVVATCAFTFSQPPEASPAGGSGSITISTTPECGWNITSNSAWITLTSSTSGQGAGSVSYSVAANTGATRSGTLTIAGNTITIAQWGPAVLTIAKSHSGNFMVGQNGAGYTVTVANAATGGPTSGAVTVTDTVPSGLTLVSMAGTGWTCAMNTCTRSDVLGSGLNYTPITVTVNIAANGPAQVTNQACVSGGGSAGACASDPTTIVDLATHFSVTAPSSAIGGVPFQFTVTALDVNNNTVTNYSNPVMLISSGGAASLPGNMTLTNGTGTFSASLVTTGTRTITATDSLNPSITGTSTSIAVSAPSGLGFIPITPCRLVDTRLNTAFGGSYIHGGTTVSYALPNGPCPGIPANAQAYSLNVAVVPHGVLGYLTIWPTGQNQPFVASLNSDGRIKSNAAIVPAGSNGAVSVYATNDTDVVLDINGYFGAPGSANALEFYPLTPCRLVDTRLNNAFGGATFAGATSRSYALPNGPCAGIPANAQAYSLNFAVVPQGPLGYLTAWPTGQAQPFVATLNAPTGTVVANAAIVPAGTNGAISVFVTNTTDLVIAMNGYFAPPGAGGLSLYNLPPCRVLDTRLPSGGAAPITGTINVNVLGSVCGGTPAVQAYVFNATVVPQAPLGYLTLWPFGAAQPFVATLNAGDQAITSNMAIVPAGSTEISAFTSNSTQLILDMSAYFAP